MDEKKKNNDKRIEKFREKVTHEKPEPKGVAPTSRPKPSSESPTQHPKNANSKNVSTGGSD